MFPTKQHGSLMRWNCWTMEVDHWTKGVAMWNYGHFLLGGERFEFPWKLMKSERTPWKSCNKPYQGTKPSDQTRYLDLEDPCMVCLPAFTIKNHPNVGKIYHTWIPWETKDAVAFWCQVAPSYRWKACAKIASSWHRQTEFFKILDTHRVFHQVLFFFGWRLFSEIFSSLVFFSRPNWKYDRQIGCIFPRYTLED